MAEKSVTELNSILHGTNLSNIPNFEENLSLTYSLIQQNSRFKSGNFDKFLKTRYLEGLGVKFNLKGGVADFEVIMRI